MNCVSVIACRYRLSFAKVPVLSYCHSWSGRKVLTNSPTNLRFLYTEPRFRFQGLLTYWLKKPSFQLSWSLFRCRRELVAGTSTIARKYSALSVNTNVVKDVILFRYENPKFYTILNIFAFCQFFFWAYLSHFAYTSLKDAPVNCENQDELAWWRKINLGENKYRNALTVICFLIGYGILASAWAFTLKSVRFLILRKGGESVTFVTYGPFGKNRMTTVPIKKVSCQEARHAAKVQLPIKVQGSYLYYILDMRGEFTNSQLFDYSAGLKRTFKE